MDSPNVSFVMVSNDREIIFKTVKELDTDSQENLNITLFNFIDNMTTKTSSHLLSNEYPRLAGKVKFRIKKGE
jgi:hypothetical protein